MADQHKLDDGEVGDALLELLVDATNQFRSDIGADYRLSWRACASAGMTFAADAIASIPDDEIRNTAAAAFASQFALWVELRRETSIFEGFEDAKSLTPASKYKH